MSRGNLLLAPFGDYLWLYAGIIIIRSLRCLYSTLDKSVAARFQVYNADLIILSYQILLLSDYLIILSNLIMSNLGNLLSQILL